MTATGPTIARFIVVGGVVLACFVVRAIPTAAQSHPTRYLSIVGHQIGRESNEPTTPPIYPTRTPTAQPTATSPAATATVPPTATRPAATVQPTATTVPQATATPQPREGNHPEVAAAVLRLINVERAAVGCPALQQQPSLTLAAERHSQDMALRNFFAHIAPDPRTTIADRTKAAGYASSFVNELLTIGLHGDASLMIPAWLNSPAHKSTMLDCGYGYAGVGVFYQAADEANVQAVTFFGERIPFTTEGYSVDAAGHQIRGPYFWYITVDVGEKPTLLRSQEGASS